MARVRDATIDVEKALEDKVLDAYSHSRHTDPREAASRTIDNLLAE